MRKIAILRKTFNEEDIKRKLDAVIETVIC